MRRPARDRLCGPHCLRLSWPGTPYGRGGGTPALQQAAGTLQEPCRGPSADALQRPHPPLRQAAPADIGPGRGGPRCAAPHGTGCAGQPMRLRPPGRGTALPTGHAARTRVCDARRRQRAAGTLLASCRGPSAGACQRPHRPLPQTAPTDVGWSVTAGLRPRTDRSITHRSTHRRELSRRNGVPTRRPAGGGTAKVKITRRPPPPDNSPEPCTPRTPPAEAAALLPPKPAMPEPGHARAPSRSDPPRVSRTARVSAQWRSGPRVHAVGGDGR